MNALPIQKLKQNFKVKKMNRKKLRVTQRLLTKGCKQNSLRPSPDFCPRSGVSDLSLSRVKESKIFIFGFTGYTVSIATIQGGSRGPHVAVTP